MKTTFLVVGALVLAFFAYGFIESSSPDGKARSQERAVIEHCHEQHGRDSLSPGAARSVASVCEKLEDDYRRKWNREP